jgi:hypothetical protein
MFYNARKVKYLKVFKDVYKSETFSLQTSNYDKIWGLFLQYSVMGNLLKSLLGNTRVIYVGLKALSKMNFLIMQNI